MPKTTKTLKKNKPRPKGAKKPTNPKESTKVKRKRGRPPLAQKGKKHRQIKRSRTRITSIRRPKKEKLETKMKKPEIQRLRGMQDILPEQGKYWDYVLKKMINLSEGYGFKKILVPVLEKRLLFERSTGPSSNVVEKQMYQFRDRAGNQVVLRPEFTPSIVRAYIEQGMFNLPQPVKLYYFGPLFRYERPQAGRMRQFYQFGVEAFGSDKPLIDAQLILLSYTLFNSLGIEISIQVNSLGCMECRKLYRSKLVNYFKFKKRWLCPDCKRRLIKNPLRVLDCQKHTCQNLILQAPQIVDNLCDDCQNHLVKTLEYLDAANVVYTLNPYLVRGLDYYTRTVFEIWPDRSNLSNKVSTTDKQRTSKRPALSIGTQNALGGGGRYDSLIEDLGGQPTPASGVAYGIERIVEEFKVQEAKLPKEKVPQIFFAQIGEKASRRALKLFNDLRKLGFRVVENFAKDSLKTQMEIAHKLEVKLTLILGQQEVIDKTIIIRDMNTGNQEVVDQEKIAKELKKRLK